MQSQVNTVILFALLIVACAIFAMSYPIYEQQTAPIEPKADGSFIMYDYYRDGMHYLLVKGPDGGMSSINLTLDSLQIKSLQ